MTDLSSVASSHLCVRKKQCLTQSRKVAKKTRAMQGPLAGTVPEQAPSSRRSVMRYLSSFASSRLCVKSECVTQRRKVAKGTSAWTTWSPAKSSWKPLSFRRSRPESSFFFCVFASLREKKRMSHAKSQSR